MKDKIYKKIWTKNQSGFTLIELVVVSGILVLSTGLIASVILNTLRGSKKSSNTNYVAQNGNYALSAITDIINKSDEVMSACNNTPSSSLILFSSRENANYTIDCGGSNIVITKQFRDTTPNPPAVSLLDTNVHLDGVCRITCSQININSMTTPTVPNPTANPYLNPLIEISFDLTDFAQSQSVDTRARALFNTSVYLRNYQLQ